MAKKKTEEPTYRKATMKKAKNYKFDKRLGKGEEVFIKEEYVGHQRYVYTAFRKKGDTLCFGVTRSEFEYTEKQKFIVTVSRVSYSTRNIEVEAIDRKDAMNVADEAAGDLEFKEDDAKYEILGVMTEEELKKIKGN